MDWHRRRFATPRARLTSPATCATEKMSRLLTTISAVRFDDRRGGESYRPADRSGRSPSRGYNVRHPRSPPRNRSPRPRADTWVPPFSRGYGRPRSRSPPGCRRRSRTPPFHGRGAGPDPSGRRRSPVRRYSPRRDEQVRSPPPASWRSRSPYSDGRSRDVSRGRVSPKRARDATPFRREYLDNDRHRRPSPSSQRTPESFHKGRSSSRSRRASPVHPAAFTESDAISRRPSPIVYPERPGGAPLRARSRSPTHHLSTIQRPSRPQGRSPSYQDDNYQTHLSTFEKVPDLERGPAGHDPLLSTARKGPEPDKGLPQTDRHAEQSQMSTNRISSNIPTQPKNHGASQVPPSGPYQGAKPPQNRGPHNVALLSAPTRPRRAPGARESSWMSSPVPRRGPVATVSHGPPSGPRPSFTSPAPSGGGYRYPNSRQTSTASPGQVPAQRSTNHLAGLSPVIPGGRVLPSTLDLVTEKRLAQLDADREKLLEQIAETQRLKRAELREWDKLDRESSISALKSELAEGHLHRMAEESIGGGILF